MNTAEYAQPLYPASRAAQVASTGPQPRADDRDRAEPHTGSGPRIRAVGPAAVADPADLAWADPAWADPVTTDRAVAGVGQRDDTDQRDLMAGDGDAPEIELLDRQRPRPGKSPRKPRKSGGPKPRKQAAPGKGRPRSGRRGMRMVLVIAGSVAVAVLAVAAYVVFRPQASHAVSTPARVGSYTRQQANAPARALKQRILAAARGDVKNVVAAVYQRTTGPGTSNGAQIVVFIGGNLAGNASASSLISAYMTRLHGAFATSAGTLGGQAACAPGSNGGPAECTWADGDTFGVVVSATLTSAGLADEMRQMRPLIEHVVR